MVTLNLQTGSRASRHKISLASGSEKVFIFI
jgi:hypothetical protein